MLPCYLFVVFALALPFALQADQADQSCPVPLPSKWIFEGWFADEDTAAYLPDVVLRQVRARQTRKLPACGWQETERAIPLLVIQGERIWVEWEGLHTRIDWTTEKVLELSEGNWHVAFDQGQQMLVSQIGYEISDVRLFVQIPKGDRFVFCVPAIEETFRLAPVSPQTPAKTPEPLPAPDKSLPAAKPSEPDTAAIEETGLGLELAAEDRCTPYRRADYRYPPSVEPRIADRDGLVSRLDSTRFGSIRESDIEHVVSLSEAHDSGMCGRSLQEKRAFARDLDNLALASVRLNRYQKRGKDAGEWLPPTHAGRCFLAATVVKVKRKYHLTVDQRELAVLDSLVRACSGH